MSIISRLPNMSAHRETIGVATALVSRVAVTSHEPFVSVVCNSLGTSGNSGTTSVCCSATSVPVIARTAVTSPAGRRRVGEVAA